MISTRAVLIIAMLIMLAVALPAYLHSGCHSNDPVFKPGRTAFGSHVYTLSLLQT